MSSTISPAGSGAAVDVAIVGYGPVGATLANFLGACGLTVLVLEREAGPYPLPRALHFDDEVMRIFQTIGLAGEIEPGTCLSPGMRFVDSQGRLMLDWSRPMVVGPQGWHASYRFHQPDLERILRRGVERFPGVTVRTRCDVFAIDQDDDGVALRFEDLSCGRLERHRAHYVVGCDGARSLVRRLIGTPLLDLGFHERWLVVDCRLKREMPELGDHSVQYCEPERPATYVRGVGDRRRWEITALPGEDTPSLTEPAKIWSLLSRWIKPADAEIERSAVYTFHSVLAESWRSGRLLVAGDAAHQTPPFLGQGMCAGIRDVGNLAWKLRAVLRGGADEALLDSYGSERAPHVREYIELAVRLGGLINTRAMEAALPGAGSTPGAPVVMQSIKPRLGPGCGEGEHPTVGTLSPQARAEDGQMLDDVVGYRFALVTGRGVSWETGWTGRCQQADVAVVSDPPDILEEWLARSGLAAALVRPDRYVMDVAGASSDIPGLIARLPVARAVDLAGGARLAR